MRITSGTLSGQRLNVPSGSTRPTTDRVREALFNALNARIDLTDYNVLDLYAGSGALGIEALSCGAASALFVEHSAQARTIITSNLAATTPHAHTTVTSTQLPHGLTQLDTTLQRHLDCLNSPHPERIELVLCDPPYDNVPEHLPPILRYLHHSPHIAHDCCLVVEYSHRTPPGPWPENFELALTRSYGETTLAIGFINKESNP